MAEKKKIWKILTIDSSKMFLMMMEDIITKQGYQHFSAENSINGIKLLDVHKQFDLIIINLELPEMRDYSLLNRLKLRNTNNENAIIITSAMKIDLDSIEKLRSYGISGLIPKSLTSEQMLFRINTALYKKDEDRKNIRALYQTMVEYIDKQETFMGNSYTISCDGIFIRTFTPLAVGETLSLKFSLPISDAVFSSTGEVIYQVVYNSKEALVHPPGMGIKFTNLLDIHKKMINDFVLECLQKEDALIGKK